ncbi:carboxylesterase family protein [Parahaliea maris]|uniref:Carboxylic ester hydrolase n=1 Tax=Parahaliea maris TaxID=2716870 RepID=A0A5C9A7L8_9GAMM|nr:carboxylesterase family protein [Parahaliea maris]TXS96109.1 carboxylesterase family protein [Parahaliea maris]
MFPEPSAYSLSIYRCVLVLSVILLLANAATVSAVSAEPAVVSMGSGQVRGVKSEGVVAFKGIPFAAPPVGELRFSAPQPAAGWQGEFAADSFPPVCTQTRYEAGVAKTYGTEDCLYLNVYTPDSDLSEGAPVLVWIHGGGRRNGDGRRPVEDFVRETGTVVVMIQYRLDHLAFFAHPALNAAESGRFSSGNYGYLDAIAALQWVQREIAAFGGAPQRVTIGGMSGGGTMVCGLMASPQAEGLFHGAIIQSGGSCWFPTDSWQIGERRGQQLVNQMGCAERPQPIECMRQQPAESFFRFPSVYNPHKPPAISFFSAMPMLGGRSGNIVDGQVFPRSFPDAFSNGAFHRVPVMIGVARHEGRRVYGDLLFQIGAGQMGSEDYLSALEGLLGSKAIAESAAVAYPLEGSGLSPIERFSDVATEAHYTCPHSELAMTLSRIVPTWMYEQQVPGTKTSPNLEMGAYHGFDTELLFGGSFDGSVPDFNAEQQEAARLFRRYVANFVHGADPNGDGLVEWKPYAGDQAEYHLAFSAEPRLETGLRERACRFWREQGWEVLPQLD